MKILAKQNREIIMINARNTQNENDAEKIILEVPEQYEDFNKKIVFITSDGVVWDIIQNNEYLIKKAITKYKQVDFYIWLTKDNVDFRTQTKTLKFYDNVDASEEITDEEIGRVNTVINILEEEITKVEDLETEIDGKLEEIDTAIDNVNTAIDEVQNLDLDAEKVNKTTTVTLTKKDGTAKIVQIEDGINLQFLWRGTSLGIKTENQEQYTFVDLQGVQGQKGDTGEPFTVKKTYSSIAEMNADFNNMQVGDYVMIASSVEVEDNAKLYTRGENQWMFITDFSGATGIRGETGLTPNIQIGTVTQGSSFNVTRTGTNENPILNFTLVKGEKGGQGVQGVKGDTGNGISTIIKTATQGLVDTYTIYYTDGRTETYTVTNGENGEVTQTQFDKLENKVKKMQNNQLTNTASGTSIDLIDSANDYVRSLMLKRNTTQKTTIGRNLLPIIPAGALTNYGVTLISNGDGSFTLFGTSNATGRIVFNLTNPVQLPEQTIYAHLRNPLVISADDCAMLFIGREKTSAPAFSQVNRIMTSEYLTNMELTQIGISFIGGKTFNITFTPSLELTNEITDYEEYTDGQPSPSPKFPWEIKNVGDSGVVNEKVCNENFIDESVITNATNWNYENGYYTGKVSDLNNYFSNHPLYSNFKENTQYTFSWKGYTGTAINTRVQFIYADGTFTEGAYINSTTEVSRNFVSSANKTIEKILLNWGSNGTIFIKDVQLKEGTESTDDVKHQEQILSFPMQQNQKILGYTAEDGIHQEYGFIEINGSEPGWKKASDDEYYNRDLMFDSKANTNRLYGFCNRVATSLNEEITFAYLSKSNIDRGIDFKNVSTYWGFTGTTVEEFKQWLSENPVKIQYKLETEDIQPYSQEQQQAYNQMQELETYKTVTHIYSEDETPANLEVEYVQDLRTVLNNMNNNNNSKN